MAVMDTGDTAVFLGIVIVIAAVIIPLVLLWTAAAESGHILLSKQAFCGQQVKLLVRHLPKAVLRVISASLTQIVLTLPFLVLFGFCIFYLLEPGLTSGIFTFLNFPVFVWIIIVAAGLVAYIIFSNIFFLAIPAAVFEKRFFFGTVIRSWQLIKGEFWKILGLRVLWLVIVALVSYSAQGIWGILSGVFDLAPFLISAGNVISSVAYMLIAFVTGPLGGIFSALIYFNQRIKKEGYGIELGIERLSNGRIL
jgi:hypothetical protein